MSPVTEGGSAPRLIDGRFELVQRLGGGGMGVVWRARDNALHRDVALKEVLPPDPAAAPGDSLGERETRQRVLREARALAQLRHPNVVIIHHIIDTPEHPHPWLVMELVTGGSLADRLSWGPLSVPEAARIGRGVLSALRAAHAVGILHRDIKPGNVLLRPDGSPVLTDFGIAAVRDVTSLTMSGSVVGSPEYIAPERLRGEEGNPSSDLWSLAMMLYVAIEGRHPLRRATMLATLAAVLDEPLPPPLHAGPLGQALAAMLAKDPQARPNAEQFDHMLAAAEHSQPPVAPPPAPWQQPQPGGFATSGNAHALGTSGWLQADAVTTHQRPQGSRRRTLVITMSVVALLIAGGITFFLTTDNNNSTGHQVALGAVHSHGPGVSTTRTTTTSATAAPPQNLLTPDGVRGVISTMNTYMKTNDTGTKVLELVVYQDYATAEAPTAADPKVYDDVKYQNGVVSHEAGSEVDDTQAPIDVGSINWDILPSLLSQAAATLNVPNPNLIYVIVDSDMNIDDSGNVTLTPEILVYRTDEYRDGYLKANIQGKVLETNPAK